MFSVKEESYVDDDKLTKNNFLRGREVVVGVNLVLQMGLTLLGVNKFVETI